ncbi:hypothetical protein B0T19DRAFT_179314 [Cercophora scortea]|uniref:Uncharacterized protein n=1 Tax=Cercophora scortea TaxID=314031 RepID=A0AAE0MED1_9PEZI|nr:hypothetical protein B0T19DRAFT_179314 [Cercophora scortea]
MMQTVDIEEPPGGPRSCWKQSFNWLVKYVKAIDNKVNKSTFGHLFRLRGCGHPDEISDANFSTELRAGLTTFATMAYIIAVNASILADSGYDCRCDDPNRRGVCENQLEWSQCHEELKLDLITATAALAGLSSIIFGLLTNLPVALAPGMGLNAYFTYQVVGLRGTGLVSYRVALTAIFVEGWIFMFLALTGMRHWLVKIIPTTIKTASGVGIGLFLTLIGMSYSAGIGIVTGAVSTPLTIGGCPVEDLDSETGECRYHMMTSPKMWVGIVFGGILTAFLMAFRVKSAIIIGIALVSFMSWPRNTPITYFPNTAEGNDRWNYFRKVVDFHPIKHTLGRQQWDWSSDKFGLDFVIALVTFLYVDLIDCTATLYSMARFCNRVRRADGGDFPRATVAYCTDALCISIGALLGCSPVTAFVESGAGIAEGGRTGITAIVTGVCFLISVFLSPILASIPPWATGCTLILVGCLMIRQVTRINWGYIGDAIPSFVTLTFMPFSYSVAYGLIAGIVTYILLNTMIWVVVKLSGETITPKDYEQKEYWTWKPPGEKPWIIRVFSKSRFWASGRDESQEPRFPLTEGEDNGSSEHGRSRIASTVEAAEGKYHERTPSPRPLRQLH